MSITTKTVLLDTLTDILKMLHPFMPYVTEEIYQKLPIKEEESIMITKYPVYNKADVYEDESNLLEKILEDIVSIRNLKANNKITKEAKVMFNCNKELIPIFTSQLKIVDENIINEADDKLKNSNYKSNNIDITYYYETSANEVNNIKEEISKLESSISRREKLLSNENYVNKAPSNIVELDRKKLAEEKEKLELLKQQI